jgi:predicted RecB family nuclease
MHLSSSRLTLAATDLGRFLACRHLTGLDVDVAFGKRKKPPKYDDPFLDLLIARGFAHEKEFLEKVKADGSAVLDIGGITNPRAREDTLAAMKAGQPAISQALLGEGDWYGYADVLRRVEKPSSLGPFSYEAIDTKLSRETRGSTILQLSFYSDILQSIQGIQPEFFHVVTPIASEKYRVSDFAAYYRLVKRRLEEAAASDAEALMAANYPEPVDHCDVCRWWQQCDSRRRGDDHLSLVAGITRLNRREFVANDVKTLERLGDLGLPIPFKPAKCSKESLEKAQDQARVQLAGRRAHGPIHELLPVEEGRGLTRLPAPSPGDVFLDLEGDHFAAVGPREYLFGMTILEAPGKTRHVSKWAVGPGDEKPIFEEILDEISRLWKANPGLHVYHYAPYEPTAFKRLMGRHATRARELDRMLRAELFVDLLAVVKQGLRASVESYSIKKLEEFYGFTRKADLRDAGAARRAVEFSLQTGDLTVLTPEVKRLVALYNEEDCVSALRLRDWLETLRPAGPRPPPKDGSESEEQEQRSKDVQDAMDALLKGVPDEKAERTPEQHARWLLAHMLEFHRREDKVTWWEYFRLKEMTESDDLLDERKVIAGLIFLERVGGTKKCPIDRYKFPSQDLDARQGAKLKTGAGENLGHIDALDRGARTVDIKKTQKMADEHPSWAFAHSFIPSDDLKASLLHLAADISKNGFTPESAARDLLLGNPPRLTKGAFGPSKGEDAVKFAKRTVLSLDRSLLAIQGPPGAGKTYTGARMIVACAKAGLKVGITAVSHKVIRNLLDAVLEAGREMKISVPCVQKIKTGAEKSDPPIPGIEEVTDNEGVLAALAAGTAQVGAGTAWMWSREDYAGAVDVLFVDEAGQASLANVLAMAQAARSVVLLGDPQQLEQPQRGTHPEGVDASALEHILAGRKTIPEGRGIFLDKTWRLPPAICAFTSELFYEGRLESRPEQEKQKLSGAPPYEGAGLWFVPVEHDGNTNSSDEEVKAVEAIVDTLLKKGSRWTNQKGETKQVLPKDILVVAPFNAQVNRLQDALESKGIRVGTVDRFQGQEGAIVIYSMATSRPEDAPRGMEFLYDLNRLNVATSRARCACILVASPRLLEPDCKTPRQMRLANAMCRYLDVASVKESR